MEKRNHKVEVIATGFEEEWNMFVSIPHRESRNESPINGISLQRTSVNPS